ncbi:MAG: alpha/beta hydrolase [Flavobacteriaceae bacterium]
MQKVLSFFFLINAFLALPLQAQDFTLKKGVITDSIQVSKDESFAIYLPKNFELNKNWPMVLVCDMQGRGKQAVSMFVNAAEDQGYVLVGSNAIHDSISISNNVLIANRLLKSVDALISLEKARVYTAGFSSGGRFASLLPSFIKGFRGVISLGATIPNYELLSSKNVFHFIGVVGNEDFSYPDMLKARTTLKRLKFPNQLWVFNGGHQWPEPRYIEKALSAITLLAMSKGGTPKDTAFVKSGYQKDLNDLQDLIQAKDLVTAYDHMNEIISTYQLHLSMDSLQAVRKSLHKDKEYRTQRRDENAALFKETLMRDEYQYNLLEDIGSLNYNNLGWWNYQVEELKKYEKKPSPERKMGVRLLSYLNALLEDNIDIETAEDRVNDEVLSYLWMLKTITEPDNFEYYLKIISDSAKYEDFGTSLFYLEELLKRGYKDKAVLYDLDNTALLRITPEYNELISKYLKDARYEIIEE